MTQFLYGQSNWIDISPKKVYKGPISTRQELNITSIISHQENANQKHEIPTHNYNENNKKDGKQQVLVRMWENWNPHML